MQVQQTFQFHIGYWNVEGLLPMTNFDLKSLFRRFQ